jgi:hypothetical protein
MADWARSARVYVRLVAHGWTQLIVVVAGGAYAVAGAFARLPLVPWWVGGALAASALFVAQFKAFHVVRTELVPETSGTRVLQAIGLVNGLGPNYWPGQMGRPVDRVADAAYNSEADEFYVRVALAAEYVLPEAEVQQDVRERMRLALIASALEGWLQRRTHAAGAWTLQSHTHKKVVAVRSLQRDGGGPATWHGEAEFLLPIGPQSQRAVLIVDAVFQPDAGAAHRLALGDLYELCRTLLETATDELAPLLFPGVVPKRRWYEREPAPVGPSIYLAAMGRGTTIGTFVDLSQLKQAPAASGVNSRASIEVPTGVRLKPGDRDAFIRDGLKKFLAASQFVDSEGPVDSLSRTASNA